MKGCFNLTKDDKRIIDFLIRYAKESESALIDYRSKKKICNSFEIENIFEEGGLLEIQREKYGDILIRIYCDGLNKMGISFLNADKNQLGKECSIVGNNANNGCEYIIGCDGNFDVCENLIGYPKKDSFRNEINSQDDLENKLRYFFDNVNDFYSCEWHR